MCLYFNVGSLVSNVREETISSYIKNLTTVCHNSPISSSGQGRYSSHVSTIMCNSYIILYGPYILN